MHECTLQELMSLYHSRRVKNKANMPKERQEKKKKSTTQEYTKARAHNLQTNNDIHKPMLFM